MAVRQNSGRVQKESVELRFVEVVSREMAHLLLAGVLVVRRLVGAGLAPVAGYGAVCHALTTLVRQHRRAEKCTCPGT